jgi:hypothetical protein
MTVQENDSDSEHREPEKRLHNVFTLQPFRHL